MSKEQEKEAKDAVNEMMGEQGKEEATEECGIAAAVVHSLKEADLYHPDGAIVVLWEDVNNERFRLVVSVSNISARALLQIPPILMERFINALNEEEIDGNNT